MGSNLRNINNKELGSQDIFFNFAYSKKFVGEYQILLNFIIPNLCIVFL